MRRPVIHATVTVASYGDLGVSSDGTVYAQATRVLVRDLRVCDSAQAPVVSTGSEGGDCSLSVLRNWELSIDVDRVLRAQGADPEVVRARQSAALGIAEQAISLGLGLLEPVVSSGPAPSWPSSKAWA